MLNVACGVGGGHDNPTLLDPTKLSPPFSRSLKRMRKKKKRSHGTKINLTQSLILGLSGRGMYASGKAGGLNRHTSIRVRV